MGARLIGSRFLVATDAQRVEWQQFDLDTGNAGKTCEGDSLKHYYIASDGEVAVVTGNRSPAQGMDLATCEVLWSIPGSAPNEARDMWKVNSTLVQRSNDRLFSLVARSSLRERALPVRGLRRVAGQTRTLAEGG